MCWGKKNRGFWVCVCVCVLGGKRNIKKKKRETNKIVWETEGDYNRSF